MHGRSGTLLAETAIEAGDRFEVEFRRDGRNALLCLPDALSGGGESLRVIEDARGELLGFSRAASASQVSLEVAAIPDTASAVWLTWLGAGRARLEVETAPATSEELQGITLAGDDLRLLRGDAGFASAEAFELSLRAAQLATHGGFDRLICLPMVRETEALEHQIRTVKTVLRRMRGRAMLCDEVGLGKTVEAGLVLSELSVRGLVKSVLVLTPPSLIEQWQGEMRRKFSIDLTSHDDPAFRAGGAESWALHDRIIASIHTAKREPHRSAIVAREWDLVIVDEAHHLRNRTTQLWKLTSEIRKQFMLLLTATPVQNNLDELFNLVTLLEPGLLSTLRSFQKRFVDRGDKLTPRNVDELHGLLAEVMVRNQRSTVGLQFTRRWATTHRVPLSEGERSLYEAAARFVREHLRAGDQRGLSRMALLSLQMALGSSAAAAAGVLSTLAENPRLPEPTRATLGDLALLAMSVERCAKADRLLDALRGSDQKLVVFTQFRATQEMLAARLREAGHDTAVFHGGLSRLAKEEAIRRFQGPAQVLLCTESGSEGRNLQFAHWLCNFDLPWNPMRIEQRVGRLSRIGQTRDVQVLNLVAGGTIEDALLHLLEAKLAMFELVIGEIDMILGNLDDQREFEDVVADIWAESADTDEFAARLEVLGNRLMAAKLEYFRQRTQDEKLFGGRFAPET